MARFFDCLDFVLECEGGFTDDPADPGGLTKYGVTQAVYDEWRDKQSLPHQTVRLIEAKEAQSLYKTLYWDKAKCGVLPQPLDLLHFDSAVNLGVGTANKLLQTALGMVAIDGVLGPQTAMALERANPLVTFARYANTRILRYVTLALLDPRREKFLRGWLRRVGLLLQET